MNINKKLLLTFLLVIAGFNVEASEFWEGYFSPTQIEVWESRILIAKGSSFRQVGTCPNLSWIVFSGALADKALSVAMLAKTTGKKIDVYSKRCDASGTYVEAVAIKLEN